MSLWEINQSIVLNMVEERDVLKRDVGNQLGVNQSIVLNMAEERDVQIVLIG